MPSKWTFSIPRVMDILKRHKVGQNWLDPFAGKNSTAEITNDIEGRGATFEMDALEFLKSRENESATGILFDPPYSADQCLRLYTPKHNGRAGRAEYLAKCRDEIARVLKQDGTAISFGWDSMGIGDSRGFDIIEIILLCHGACHNDTIITIDKKRIKHQLQLF